MSSSPALETGPSTLDRFRDRWTWTAVVANLVGQILIIVTGGAVRLTGSGLGCSTWPQCEPGEFTPRFHDATSIHPFIEFGNRTVSGLLVAVATVVAVLVVLDRRRPWSYRRLGLVPVVGVLIQAVIGGITVLVDLHPAIVGGHLLISMALVAFSTWLVVRTREGDGPAVPLVDRTTRLLVRVLSVLAAVVLVLGVVVTGAGPHSGDEEVGYRFAVDPWTMSKVHAASVWAFVAVLVVVLVLLHRRRVTGRPEAMGYTLLAVTLAQGAIGYVQLFSGLPIGLVNLHMLGAAVLASAVTFFVGSLRTRDSV